MSAGRKPGGAKTGGRQPGAENKVTREVKEALTKLIKEAVTLDAIKERLDMLEPKEYIDAVAKLLPYIVSKAPQEIVAKDAMIIVRKRK